MLSFCCMILSLFVVYDGLFLLQSLWVLILGMFAQLHPFYGKTKQNCFQTSIKLEGILADFVCGRVNS